MLWTRPKEILKATGDSGIRYDLQLKDRRRNGGNDLSYLSARADDGNFPKRYATKRFQSWGHC